MQKRRKVRLTGQCQGPADVRQDGGSPAFYGPFPAGGRADRALYHDFGGTDPVHPPQVEGCGDKARKGGVGGGFRRCVTQRGEGRRRGPAWPIRYRRRTRATCCAASSPTRGDRMQRPVAIAVR